MELYDGRERIGNSLIVGKPILFAYANQYLGVNPANGRQMFDDGTGTGNYTYVAGESTLGYRGSYLPKSFGGLANSFSYGALSLEVFFQYQFGNIAQNADVFNLQNWGSGTGNLTIDQLDYWKNPGDIKVVGRPFEGGQAPGTSAINTFSDRILSDGGYIRLKQVTLNYNFPSSLASRVGMSGANVFVQGLNLATFTKFNGIDPEASSIGNSFGVYPNARQIAAGINLKF
jgi:hypothetical protein